MKPVVLAVNLGPPVLLTFAVVPPAGLPGK